MQIGEQVDLNYVYSLSEKEVVKSMQLHAKATKNVMSALVASGVFLILISVFTQYYVIASIALVGGIIGYCVVYYLITPFNAKKQYAQNRALRCEVELSLTDKHLTHGSEFGVNTLLWEDIHYWKSTSQIYLLYITNNSFYMLPTRVVSNNDALQLLLNNHIGKRIT